MPTVTIPANLGGGWVELRDSLSWSQQQRMDTAGAKYIRLNGRVVASDEIDLYEHFIALLELWIKDWSLTDSQGQRLPIGRAGVEHDDFKIEVGDFLFEAIREHREASVRSKSGQDQLVS